MKKIAIGLLMAAALCMGGISVRAEEPYLLTIKDHRFTPAELVIPADTKVKITIVNEDVTPEEFESYELNREKVVKGKSKITVFVGPLKKGEYPFFGEFHKETATGKIVVK